MVRARISWSTSPITFGDWRRTQEKFAFVSDILSWAVLITAQHEPQSLLKVPVAIINELLRDFSLSIIVVLAAICVSFNFSSSCVNPTFISGHSNCFLTHNASREYLLSMNYIKVAALIFHYRIFSAFCSSTCVSASPGVKNVVSKHHFLAAFIVLQIRILIDDAYLCREVLLSHCEIFIWGATLDIEIH